MDRRTFLLSSSSFILGNLLGLNSLSKALAFDHIDQNPRTRPRLALIIDDIGASLSHAKPFLDLHVPMTFAILPRLAASEESASLIHKEGHEIMLHQPMEPRDRGLSPGPGALYVGDEPTKISHTVEKNISSVPFATGMNNHMGSRFTASLKEMFETLQVVKDRGLFFVDSLTTGDSKVTRRPRRSTCLRLQEMCSLTTEWKRARFCGSFISLRGLPQGTAMPWASGIPLPKPAARFASS